MLFPFFLFGDSRVRSPFTQLSSSEVASVQQRLAFQCPVTAKTERIGNLFGDDPLDPPNPALVATAANARAHQAHKRERKRRERHYRP